MEIEQGKTPQKSCYIGESLNIFFNFPETINTKLNRDENLEV